MNGELATKAASNEASCQATFNGREECDKLADYIESNHPDCACEKFRVSPASSEPVADIEEVYRVAVSPRDIDQDGVLMVRPFEKVAREGVSVIRSISSPEQFGTLVCDGLYSKPGDPLKSIQKVYTVPVGGTDGIRAQKAGEGARLFGVYDQVVSRTKKEELPVPTHAGIFLRLPPPGTANRRKIQKDYAGQLREMFLNRELPIDGAYEGLLTKLNERAAASEFVLKAEDGE